MQVLSEASTLCTRMTPALTSMFQVAGKDYAKFWYALYETKTWLNWHYYCYQFHHLQLFVRGDFSRMNYIKNEFMTQEHLNACMSIALCDHTIETFPFERCL